MRTKSGSVMTKKTSEEEVAKDVRWLLSQLNQIPDVKLDREKIKALNDKYNKSS